LKQYIADFNSSDPPEEEDYQDYLSASIKALVFYGVVILCGGLLIFGLLP